MRQILIISTMMLNLALAQNVYPQDTTDSIVWYPPIQLTDTSYSAYSPKIALSGDDTIHVTWWGGKRIPHASSVNGGLTWNLRDLILDTVTYPYPFASNIIAAQNQNVYFFSAGEPTSQITVPRETRIHKSSDGGISWSEPTIIGEDSVAGISSANVNGDTLIIVYSPIVNGFVKREMMIVSTDAGQTWTKRPDTLDGWTRTALTHGTLHLVRDVLTNGAQEKLYLRSTDLGNTWEKTDTLSTVDGKWSYEHAITAYNGRSDSNNIMVVWRDGVACAGMVGCTIIERESRSDGLLWLQQDILTENPRGSVPSVGLNRNNVTAVSWKDEIEALDNKKLFVRVRMKPDSAWCSPVDITPNSYVTGFNDIAVSSKAIHVVYNNTVGNSFCVFYRRGEFLTTDVKENKELIPNEFSLSQNYPNPFNPCTKIRFTIQASRFTTLKVYDVFGREATTLVNEIRQPGEYTITWDAGHFASGVYYIRMNAGEYFSTRKAILMK